MDNYIEHEGVVVAVNKENVVVRIIQNSACSGCHAKGACSAADRADKEIEAVALESDKFSVGETVLLRGSDHLGRQAVLIAFVLPFILMLVMIFLIMYLFNNEGIAGLGAICILIPYYAILYMKKDKLKKKFVFQVLKLDVNK
ncbi:MAG: SoxR reducing system RseC family protein [Bacteroidales bacterium]